MNNLISSRQNISISMFVVVVLPLVAALSLREDHHPCATTTLVNSLGFILSVSLFWGIPKTRPLDALPVRLCPPQESYRNFSSALTTGRGGCIAKGTATNCDGFVSDLQCPILYCIINGGLLLCCAASWNSSPFLHNNNSTPPLGMLNFTELFRA